PMNGKPGGHPININVYAHHPALLTRNTPQQYILRIPIGVEVPQFFLAAGKLDTADVQGAEYFRQLLLTRVASVPLMVVRGGGHQAMVWRSRLRRMLDWMTTQATDQEQRDIAVAERTAADARQAERHAERHWMRGRSHSGHPLTRQPLLPPPSLPRPAQP